MLRTGTSCPWYKHSLQAHNQSQLCNTQLVGARQKWNSGKTRTSTIQANRGGYRLRNAYGEQKVLLETQGMIDNLNHKARNSPNAVQNTHLANSKD